MSRRTVIFASVAALLVPVGALLVLALNPHVTWTSGIQIVLDRGRERPAQWLVLGAWMGVFALLGAGLARLVGSRKGRRARGFPVTVKPPVR